MTELRKCGSCLLPETYETIEFDTRGVCNVCKGKQFRDEQIDWPARKVMLDELVEQLEKNGAHLYVPRGDRDYAIEVGLRSLTLRHLVSETDGLYAIVPKDQKLLAYYANSIAHLV